MGMYTAGMTDNGVPKFPIKFMIFLCTTLNLGSGVQRVHVKSWEPSSSKKQEINTAMFCQFRHHSL